MWIHAVMAGVNGDNSIEYVELRMFRWSAWLAVTRSSSTTRRTLKATFTFPSSVTNSNTGESILIATSEYNTASVGPGSGGSW
jgi:hypothetical protein